MADYNEAIRLDRRLTSAYCNRAAAWLEQNDYDKAIADYNEAIRLEPDSPFAYDGRANAWLGKQDYDKAINDYNEAIRLNSWVVQALGDLSESTNDSIKPLVSILAYAYYGRSAAWLGKNEYDKAIADYDDVLRLDPRLAAAYVCRGGVWRVKGDYVRASSNLARPFDSTPKWHLLTAAARGFGPHAPIHGFETLRRPSSRQQNRACSRNGMTRTHWIPWPPPTQRRAISIRRSTGRRRRSPRPPIWAKTTSSEIVSCSISWCRALSASSIGRTRHSPSCSIREEALPHA